MSLSQFLSQVYQKLPSAVPGGLYRQGDSFILSHIYQLREMSCYMEGLLEGLLHGLVSCGWFKGATSQGQCTTSLPLFI